MRIPAIRPATYVKSAALTLLGSLLVVVIPLGVLVGPVAALAALCLGLLAAGAYHVRNLTKLVQWTREPIGTPLPRAVGVWDFVFSDMNRRSRLATHQREKLSAALDRFREASQAMPSGLIFLSAANTIEWLNTRAEQHFGLDYRRDLGAPLTNLVRQPDFVMYVESGQYNEPFVFRTNRLPAFSLAIQVVPFGDDMKLLLSQDMSQMEKLETMRRDFVANVSHEMRTPLTVVSGFLETLADSLEDLPHEEARRYIGLAMDQAARMDGLIQDLLTLSALETGAPLPLDEPVDMSNLLEDVLAQAEALSSGRHSIVLELASRANVLGSAKELYSAIANLASNAVRYTPAGGHIRISWRMVDGLPELSVEDDGIGIAAQHIPRLTERFYRVDRGRSRETGGTGLGLAIVKHVLTRHQASLAIDSEPGRGSRFSVRFPARRVLSREAPVHS